ncbi:hypothetical protein [Methanospirillum sp.]|nr:hypothetical protein [Methanospirillum sp.]
MQTAAAIDYKPSPMEITKEEFEHISDPIGKIIVADYIKRGYWTLV